MDRRSGGLSHSRCAASRLCRRGGPGSVARADEHSGIDHIHHLPGVSPTPRAGQHSKVDPRHGCIGTLRRGDRPAPAPRAAVCGTSAGSCVVRDLCLRSHGDRDRRKGCQALVVPCIQRASRLLCHPRPRGRLGKRRLRRHGRAVLPLLSVFEPSGRRNAAQRDFDRRRQRTDGEGVARSIACRLADGARESTWCHRSDRRVPRTGASRPRHGGPDLLRPRSLQVGQRHAWPWNR